MKLSKLPQNVFYDPQIFFLQRFGGISKYFINLLKNIEKNKFSPKIIAPISNNFYLENISSEFKKNYISINKYPRFTRKISEIINEKYFRIYCNIKKPAIIHSTYYKDYKDYKSKVVITVYDLIYEIFEKKYNFKNLRTFRQKTLERADHIICISNNTKKDLLKYYNLDDKKISVILLGKPEGKDYELIDNVYLRDPFILFVGDRFKYKNFISLAKAFSSSKKINSNFNLICFGNIDFTNDEINFFKKENISLEKIKFFSGNDYQLNYLYKKASLYVCPSIYEGFGLTLLEAMNMNCPIIASNTSSIKEVGSNVIKYFDPYNIDDITLKIENLIFDNVEKNKMIKLYKDHLENFSWKKNALETQKIYSRII